MIAEGIIGTEDFEEEGLESGRGTRPVTVEEIDDEEDYHEQGLGADGPILEEIGEDEWTEEEDNNERPSLDERSESDDDRSPVEDDGQSTDERGSPNVPRSRPSEYLRQRCPLCFGGKDCHDPDTV